MSKPPQSTMFTYATIHSPCLPVPNFSYTSSWVCHHPIMTHCVHTLHKSFPPSVFLVAVMHSSVSVSYGRVERKTLSYALPYPHDHTFITISSTLITCWTYCSPPHLPSPFMPPYLHRPQSSSSNQVLHCIALCTNFFWL